MTEPTKPADDAPDRDPARFVFAAVAPCGAVFVVTILAMIAAAFGDPTSGAARFLDEHGLAIIAWEAGVTVVVTLLAMAVDRWLVLRRSREDSNDGE